MTQPDYSTTTLFVSTRLAAQPHVRALIESHSGQTLEYWRQFGRYGYAELECRREALHELVRELKSQPQPKRRHHQRKPCPPVPGGLLTPAQAAAKLNCSIKTLNGYVIAGALKYVIIGHGTKRPRKMFADADLDEFIAAQTRKDQPCPSAAIRGRRSGNTISKSEVVAFSDLQNARTAAKRKK